MRVPFFVITGWGGGLQFAKYFFLVDGIAVSVLKLDADASVGIDVEDDEPAVSAEDGAVVALALRDGTAAGIAGDGELVEPLGVLQRAAVFLVEQLFEFKILRLQQVPFADFRAECHERINLLRFGGSPDLHGHLSPGHEPLIPFDPTVVAEAEIAGAERVAHRFFRSAYRDLAEAEMFAFRVSRQASCLHAEAHAEKQQYGKYLAIHLLI